MSIVEEAFGLYCQAQSTYWKRPTPPSLTFDNWVKYSSQDTIDEYIALARGQRNNRKKSKAELDWEHSIKLRENNV